MKKYQGIRIVLTLLFAFTQTKIARAEETLLPETESFEEVEPIASEANDFARDNEDLGAIKARSVPTCDDPEFVEKIRQSVENYWGYKSTVSTLEQRKKALALANLKHFESVSPASFSPTTDVNTANALITIKINLKIGVQDILLCRQTDVRETPIYVISYPYADNYKCHVINADPKNGNYDELVFMYP